MNKPSSITNKFLLAGDKFLLELHLVDPFAKNTMHVDTLQNTDKEFKVFKKQAS